MFKEMPTFENPEKKRKEHLVKAFEAGLDDVENIIGYHGTSLEAIESLLETGRLPGWTKESNEFMQKGDLSFYPLKSRFEGHSLENTFPEKDVAVEITEACAKNTAGEHCLLKQLGIDLGDKKYKRIARSLSSLSWFEEEHADYEKMLKDGFAKKTLDEAIKKAKNREGVIISLSDKLLKKFSPSPGDENEGDLKINFPDGFDYSYISGIKPIGQEEREYFEKLQKKN